MDYPYLLLDAGGTLVFLDQDLMARTVEAEGASVAPDDIYDSHYRLLHRYDTQLRDGRAPLTATLHSFLRDMLTGAGVPEALAEQATAKLVGIHEQENLWTYTKPWVSETLAALKQAGVRMSIISNADGRVEQQLQRLGLHGYFDAVFDSSLVGVEKPDPRLFLHALDKLGLKADETIYVGDFWYPDIVGANRAGIGAVHLDPSGLYADWPGVHLRDIRELPGWFEQVKRSPERFNLFPAVRKG